MKIKFILLAIATTILLVGCDSGAAGKNTSSSSYSQDELVDKSSGYVDYKKVKAKADELMKNYENGMVKAINENDFSKVELYIVANSSLYESQKKLVNDLHSQGITENLVSYQICNFYYTGFSNTYKANVVEQIETRHPKNGTSKNDYQWTYSIEIVDNQVKLSKIEKWTPDQNNTSTSNTQATTKPQGYYADMIIDSDYDSALIKELNNRYDGSLDKLFENSTAKGRNSDAVKSIRSYGTNFSIRKSEVLKRSSANPYEASKRIIIKYKDKGSKYKEVTLYITLIVKEDKSNSGGNAIITDVKNIRIQ